MRKKVKLFGHLRVTVHITHDTADIATTWIDPEEGEINAVQHVSLGRDELAWVVGKVIEA